MGITYGDHLIDSGYYDITPEQEREIEAREECARRGLDPDDDAADGVAVWMVVDQELRLTRGDNGWRHPVGEGMKRTQEIMERLSRPQSRTAGQGARE